MLRQCNIFLSPAFEIQNKMANSHENGNKLTDKCDTRHLIHCTKQLLRSPCI